MKVFIILLFFGSFVSNAQFTVKKYSYIHPKCGANEFPIIQSETNPKAALAINEYLYREEFSIHYTEEVGSNRFSRMLATGKYLDSRAHYKYIVHANNERYFSIRIEYFSTGPFPTRSQINYNFDSVSGRNLELEDLFEPDHLNEIAIEIHAARKVDMATYMAKVDTSTKIGLQQYRDYKMCFDDMDSWVSPMYFFLLKENGIEFIEESCAFRVQLEFSFLGDFIKFFPFNKLESTFTVLGKQLFIDSSKAIKDE